MASPLLYPRGTASTMVSLLLLLLSLSSQSSVVQAAVPQKVSHVIHIVADGLRADYLTAGHPAFDYLLQSGACTLNARHDDLSSQTLPNHISMFTGLPISEHGYQEDKDYGGNSTLVDTTDPNDHQPFTSIFDLVDSSRASGLTNGRTAIFTSKTKFQLFDRSFPVSSYFENKKSKAVIRRFVNEMTNKQFAYSYLHIVDPDLNGHRYDGAASVEYAQGVALASYRLGEVLDMIATNDVLRDDTAIILTADHGFSNNGNHANQDDPTVYHIPFCAWGPGVQPHANLYAINRGNGSGLANPGDDKGRGQRVVRNTYAGVLAADFLGIRPDEGAFADQYMAVNDGTENMEAAMTWEEWKVAKANDYDWSEPSDEEIVAVDSTDGNEGSNDAADSSPVVSVPIEEVSKKDNDQELPVPISDVEEPIVNTEEAPVPIDMDEEINTEEAPVPVEVEVEEKEKVEEEASTVLIPPSPPSEEVSKANSMPEKDEPIDTTQPSEAEPINDIEAKEGSTDTGVQDQETLWESISESQDTEDEGGVGPDISAFIKETTHESNTSSQTSGLNGIEIGLIAASAVAILALVAAVYIYATTHKTKSQQANAGIYEDDLEKAGGHNNKLDETRVSVSSGSSDDGTDNLFTGYASSSTFDEESCIGRGRSFNRSSSAMSSRSYSLNEAADAHARAVEAGVWPDDVVPLESVEVEAVEVTVTESKTIWHIVDLQR